MYQLTLITLEGGPLQLVAGDAAYCARESHRRIVEHYCQRTGRLMPADVEGFTDPYYRGAGQYQAIGGHTPQKGHLWQLADKRHVMIDEAGAGRVSGSLVKYIGLGGAPAFFAVELAYAELDGATFVKDYSRPLEEEE